MSQKCIKCGRVFAFTVPPNSVCVSCDTNAARSRYKVFTTYAEGHYPGKGCQCAARNADECGCKDANWISMEQVALTNVLNEILEASLCDDSARLYQARANARELLDCLKTKELP